MSLLSELKRRKVFKVGAAYLIIAWLIIQVADTVFPSFGIPDWAMRMMLLIVALGLPVALVLAWVFDMSADGVKIETGSGNRGFYLLIAVLTLLGSGWYWFSSQNDAQAELNLSPSIAVLPFVNLSGNADEEYFSDGMTEELLNVLAKVPKLEVAARTSVFEFKNKGGDIREIGRKLGVNHILEGSVRRDGETVRITAQLIRVSDGFHMWSNTYDRKLKSIFALQDEIAQQVGTQLVSSLLGKTVAPHRSDIDPKAYDLYLKGRALLRARKQPLTAITQLRQATQLAPNFAPAWATLSLTIDISAYLSSMPQQAVIGTRLPQQLLAAERASSLSPNSALTLHALGNVARASGEFVNSESYYQQAIAADPTYADVREDYSELLTAVGRTREALNAARDLVKLEPLMPVFWYRIAAIGILLDDASLVNEAVGKMLALNPKYFFGLTANYRRAINNGRPEKARLFLEHANLVNPEASASDWLLFRWSQGDPSIKDELAHSLIFGKYSWGSAVYPGFKGHAKLFFDRLMLNRDTDKHFYNYQFLSIKVLRHYLKDPRAKKILRNDGFVKYWRVKGWPALCHPLEKDDFECGEVTAKKKTK